MLANNIATLDKFVDHNIVKFDLAANALRVANPLVKIRKFSDGQFSKLNFDLQHNDWSQQLDTCFSIQTKYEAFATQLKSLFDHHCPEKTVNATSKCRRRNYRIKCFMPPLSKATASQPACRPSALLMPPGRLSALLMPPLCSALAALPSSCLRLPMPPLRLCTYSSHKCSLKRIISLHNQSPTNPGTYPQQVQSTCLFPNGQNGYGYYSNASCYGATVHMNGQTDSFFYQQQAQQFSQMQMANLSIPPVEMVQHLKTNLDALLSHVLHLKQIQCRLPIGCGWTQQNHEKLKDFDRSVIYGFCSKVKAENILTFCGNTNLLVIRFSDREPATIKFSIVKTSNGQKELMHYFYGPEFKLNEKDLYSELITNPKFFHIKYAIVEENGSHQKKELTTFMPNITERTDTLNYVDEYRKTRRRQL
ncbi:signal transducer and activator of transcription b [Ditylenchus destructor]|uniref:Signal transducer and activator of transcription b n=1 Tax=Ditylenchus destructor TaxID=166010 RepID=A0AAD4QXE8_9BILA|nr:signal transducer and activator of transcription b [Ditylenchus destructor]